MKIYTVQFDMTKVPKEFIKAFALGKHEGKHPHVFVEAKDPDGACYVAYCELTEMLLKQDESYDGAVMIKNMIHKIRIVSVYCKDER